MRPDQTRVTFGFGTRLTRLGKSLLLIYGIIFVLELLLEHWFKVPVASVLPLYPLTSESFHLWQLVTHAFIHNPYSPFGFLITCLVFYFFAAPVEKAFGPKRFLTLFYLSALGGAVCGLGFSSVSGFDAPFMGIMPSLLSLIVVFGLLNPEATILLMFILPVKAKYLSYGTILITALTFLAKANPHGAYHLGGILLGFIYFKGPGNVFDVKLTYFKFRAWQIKRKRDGFHVVQGYKDGEDNDNRPTIH